MVAEETGARFTTTVLHDRVLLWSSWRGKKGLWRIPMYGRARKRERKGAKVEWKTRRKGENGQWRIIRVSVARRGWNSWLDRSRLRDGDKLFISRRLATGQHFPYLSTILRLFIRAWAHVVVGRASLSPLCLFPSFTPTVATVHPRNSWSFPKIHEDSRTFTIRIKCSETNGKGREIKLK